ncbi:DUF3788 domain-containing protein [Blautia coccoides]|uniref:DUF3788 family protein n=1 Tax=Blautia TaxID=572511 RepID=UPI001D02C1BD|nr:MULTISPECIES: DUF3788 family protein [Blautia]MCB5873787.1 DUF3788 domain-containing protein [Blautia producta]MCQ4640830.1 DUF3788 domain-containing protein [Blautia coccoides]
MQVYFITLVVIGRKEMREAELLIPLCSDYVQTVFKNTKVGNGQKWLMIEGGIEKFCRTCLACSNSE